LADADLAQARDGATLRVSVLARLPERRLRNALRQWLAERELPPPDQRRLREIAGPLLRSRPDALPSVRWRGAQVRRHADRLFAVASAPQGSSSVPAAPSTLREPLEWNWRSERWL